VGGDGRFKYRILSVRVRRAIPALVRCVLRATGRLGGLLADHVGPDIHRWRDSAQRPFAPSSDQITGGDRRHEHRRADGKPTEKLEGASPHHSDPTVPLLIHRGDHLLRPLYNGYLYGLSFLLNGAVLLVSGARGHGFDTLHVGLCFLGVAGGITIGPFTNIIQGRRYRRRLRRANGANVPEARLFMSKIAGVTFPISLFWFAWSTSASVNAAVPILATALWGWSFYTLILMTYTYTEDSYKQYAASALAGLGFVRNIAGAGFPLFGNQMFENE